MKIWENQADFGGGVSLINSNTTLNKLAIIDNHTSFGGAGLSCGLSSNPQINNLKVLGNIANSGTAGMHFFYDSNPLVTNSIISGNINYCSAACGGGISCVSASPTFKSLIVTNNSASSGGGFDLGDSNAILENVLISNNHCLHSGPGLWIANSSPVIINSTITNNISDATSSNIYCVENVDLTMINTISWSEQYYEIWFHWGGLPSNVNIAYSNVKNGLNGINTNNNGTVNWLVGNIDSVPMFANQNELDFHLRDNSPCIGTGIDEIVINGTNYFSPIFDLEGNPRPSPFGSMPDLGAYENPLGEPQVSLNNFEIPKHNYLLSNYPNPFNPSTTISFSLNTELTEDIELIIYNLKGQKLKAFSLAELACAESLLGKASGTSNNYSVVWNGCDQNNRPVSSGVYFYQLKVDGKAGAKKKCLLLK